MNDAPPNEIRIQELCEALDVYRRARQRILSTLGVDVSNRDPLAEWSEHIVTALVGGELASSRVQAGYDLTAPSGLRVQVRYLANPKDAWVNWHVVRTPAGADRYVLVLFEAFEAIGILMFPPHLTAICDALAKRHSDQDVSLQFTRRNWRTIRDDPDRFRQLGMAVWLPPFATAPIREDS